jgi:uncharacterized protein (DUF362 family)
MSGAMNRREILVRGLGTAVALAGGRLPLAWSTEQESAVPPLPDCSKNAPSMPVAIQRCDSYEPSLVRRKLDAALELIGGVDKLVRNKTVTVKLNLTGNVQQLCGLPACRTYHIHPSVVAALCAALIDAGAQRIALVEALYYREPIEKILMTAGWDIAAIQAAGGHKVILENTKNRGSWPTYSRLKVPWGGYIFPAFDVNQWYEKTDVFVSLAKLKEHASAGVTMASKNLFGILPTALYGDDAPNEDTVKARGALLHMGQRAAPDGVPGEIDRGVPRDWRYRVPRIVADVVCARPVNLAVIDGIDTIRGGEGYWNEGVEPIQPKLLLVGRNVVCTDAVCTAVMGHDPMAADARPPFPGENYLQLLAAAGVGTNDIDRIEVSGVPLKEAIYPFTRKLVSVEAMNS